jgi:hypothetical protein
MEGDGVSSALLVLSILTVVSLISIGIEVRRPFRKFR